MKSRSKYLIGFKNNNSVLIAFTLSIIFLVISVFVISSGGTMVWLIPPALLLAFVGFFAIDKFLLLTVFLVPVSIQLRFILPETSIDIFLPTELMLAGILLLMIFKLFYSREISRKILVHPVSVISFCLLGWCLITSLTSTLPIVSLKSFITRLWFFAGFYLLAAQLFGKRERIRNYFYAYIAGMVPVVIYYLTKMGESGFFNQQAAYMAIQPFFNDHTSFGAALAFCIPVIIYFITTRETTKTGRLVLLVILILFSAAIVLSYSRAAWLSVIVSVLVVSVLLMRISWKIIIPAIISGLIVLSISWTDLVLRLNENKQESSGNFKSHIQSMANIRSDASNMERFNRWKSAMKMFRERPVLGWGPATFQFKYAPYQMVSDKTIISTNYGEGGNAHSEYIGALIDSGIPGAMMYILLLFISIRRAIIIFKTHLNRQIRFLVLALIAGLVTYVLHGALNNFLDTDKISVLFWGMIAAITAIDIGMKDEAGKAELSEIGNNN
jgi:putative inorganic carbon (HCO3(-)) transporter